MNRDNLIKIYKQHIAKLQGIYKSESDDVKFTDELISESQHFINELKKY